MTKRALTALLAAAVAALSACSTSDTSSTPTTVSTPAGAARPSALQLGQTIEFTRTDTGARIGTLRFTDARELPATCLVEPGTEPILAIRIEIENAPGEKLPVPDAYALKYNDSEGVTHEVEPAAIYGCDADYPEAVSAPVGGKVKGWIAFEVAILPAALMYSPLVSDQSSSYTDIKFLTVSPATVTIDLPDPLAAVPPSSSTSAVRPTPAAPPTGRDSEGRPNGSGGAVVACADENYQPGTGIYADGSKGFAPECLPGGALAPR
ncbi:hypothetical protein IU459_11670 [Nocardia amamiensis]|uniref:DUF4352 domain-containing protein n=1 Tax=Nocardia amamiensis TaxID=404578 RepID=A0ABS0CTV8_9NOCA|nr:hypothetical protein [Nocardia amamiensis]MBF6298198.1 hypothetical protein [Nocardia amamiensis]